VEKRFEGNKGRELFIVWFSITWGGGMCCSQVVSPLPIIHNEKSLPKNRTKRGENEESWVPGSRLNKEGLEVEEPTERVKEDGKARRKGEKVRAMLSL